MSKFAKALVALVAASTMALAPVAAQAVTPGVGDQSNAVRYGNDGPLGTISEDLEFSDDTSTVIESPFLLNFFGETYTHLCVSNNGGVFPTNDLAAECAEYDYDVAALAGSAESPMIAVLASDTDTSACDATRAELDDNGTPDDEEDDFFTAIDDGWALPCSVYVTANDPRVTVYYNDVEVINVLLPEDFSDVSSVKIGFASGTGGSTDNHDVWGLTATVSPNPPALAETGVNTGAMGLVAASLFAAGGTALAVRRRLVK